MSPGDPVHAGNALLVIWPGLEDRQGGGGGCDGDGGCEGVGEGRE